MASSRLGRLFGRGRTSKSDGAAMPIPDPRPGGGPAPTRVQSVPSYGPPSYGPQPASGPPSYGPQPASGPPVYGQQPAYGQSYGTPPAVARGRLAEVAHRRKSMDQQVGQLERFEARLSEQVHAATQAERHDYVRELLSRRLSVSARLEEVTYRRGQLRDEEQKLNQELARQEGRHPVRSQR
jgi:predicted lipid-binding transport protein (Tim44 family)